MKRILCSVIAAALVILGGGVAYAQSHVVRDIDVTVSLSADGNASVREVWDVSVNTGTEWYLTRYNLGDIRISNLSVSENGMAFINEGEWDVNRSIGEKAGRCGIAGKPSEGGCEICWGLGSYGNHVFTVEYEMSNVVKSMDDFDCLHLQFVSQGISPYPQHARVTVKTDALTFDDSRTAIWGFGYDGSVGFVNGTIVADTEKPFESDFESVIVLARFEKGMFSPSSSIPGTFQSKLDSAFEKSDYKTFLENERRQRNGILGFFAAMALFIGGVAFSSVRKRNKNMFGVLKLKEIGYSREIPFDGNLFGTRYVLSKCKKMASEANFASALILKMIKDGLLEVTNDSRGKILISFRPNPVLDGLGTEEREFYDMLYEASGDDHVLQEKEFSRWSSRMTNARRVSRWVEGLTGAGASFLQKNGFVDRREFTESGKRQARNVIGFKKFLEDFTLSAERKSAEVALWQDYLIYASIYGIAKKIAKEMKDIDPKLFQESFGYDYVAMNRVLLISSNMGNSVIGSVAKVQTRASVSGRGGHASFGGGGGFSGGGFGGGAR